MSGDSGHNRITEVRQETPKCCIGGELEQPQFDRKGLYKLQLESHSNLTKDKSITLIIAQSLGISSLVTVAYRKKRYR